jgi:putative glutamine amidotransferase
MQNAPLILITPSTQQQGVEFGDASISLSNRYSKAIFDAGGVPLIMPIVTSKELIEEYVRRSDGVLMTGGDDVQTKLFAPKIDPKLAALVKEVEPERDVLELELVDQIFRQKKPVLCICRGHQMLNVALGGTLIVDIPAQVGSPINHRRMDAKMDAVHEVNIDPKSDLARLIGSEPIGVNSTHHQAVGRVAKALKVTGKSPDGIVEAMELSDRRMLPFLQSVQFHPERMYDRFPRLARLFQAFIQACFQSPEGTPRK